MIFFFGLGFGLEWSLSCCNCWLAYDGRGTMVSVPRGCSFWVRRGVRMLGWDVSGILFSGNGLSRWGLGMAWTVSFGFGCWVQWFH